MREEQPVLEGQKLKILCAKRQTASLAQSGVTIDTLRFTVAQRPLLEQERLLDDFDNGILDPAQIAHYFTIVLAQLLGFFLGEQRSGRDYYESTWTIHNGQGMEIASVSAGDSRQRSTVLFSLKGQGRTYARTGWEQKLHQYFEHLKPKITRIDLARDFFDGEVTVENIVEQYKNHEFSYRKRLPSYEMHGA